MDVMRILSAGVMMMLLSSCGDAVGDGKDCSEVINGAKQAKTTEVYEFTITSPPEAVGTYWIKEVKPSPSPSVSPSS